MTRRTLRLLSLVALAALVGCRDGTGPSDELASARQRWLRARPAQYALTLSVSCECLLPAQPVVVEVQGDSIVARRVRATGAPVDPTLAPQFATVDGLFAVIDQALARKAARLDVQYDPALGYPTHISIDYSQPTVDDEIAYTVAAFERR